MKRIIVNGGKKLYGEVQIPVAKNSILPILAATVLCNEKTCLKNVPMLADTISIIEILKSIGMKVEKNHSDLWVSTGKTLNCNISNKLMQSMRSSIFFLAPLIVRCKTVKVINPGGCKIGDRPIDIHLAGLQAMGVEVIKGKDGSVVCKAENGLQGANFKLRLPSVGATETLLMAAATAKGETVLENVATEPEVEDLANFLNTAGAKIYGAGTDKITIIGVEKLNGCSYTPIPDRITATTILAAVAITGGKVRLQGVKPFHITKFLEILVSAGVKLSIENDSLTIISDGNLKSIGNVKTGVYPLLATDAAPILAAMLLTSKGESVIDDTIFTNRFKCGKQFNKLKANTKNINTAIKVDGVAQLKGARLKAQDLRGGAALVVAALAAKGKSTISGYEFINRGYQDITQIFKQIGADINLIN